jgi:hypothetical protein
VRGAKKANLFLLYVGQKSKFVFVIFQKGCWGVETRGKLLALKIAPVAEAGQKKGGT